MKNEGVQTDEVIRQPLKEITKPKPFINIPKLKLPGSSGGD
jgi:hypothetical protein